MKPGFVLKSLDAVTDWIGKITSFLMFGVIGYMIACVILRYFFYSSINYMSVVPNVFYVYVSFGAGYAYNQNAFINIDIFYRKFSVRVRAIIDLITSILFFLFVLALIRVSVDFALQSLPKRFDWGMVIDPARWPVTVIFPIGLILLLVSGTVRLVRNLLALATGEKEIIAAEAPGQEEEAR